MRYQNFWPVLAILLSALSPRLDAGQYHYDPGFTNLTLIPGIEYTLNIRVLDRSNRTASNYFGRLKISSSAEITFDFSEKDVLRGLAAGTNHMKARTDLFAFPVLISDEQDLVPGFTMAVTAPDPESKGPAPLLVINELMYDTDFELDEWIEFYNPSASAVVVTNFTIVTADSASPDKNEQFYITNSAPTVPVNSFTVAAGGYLVAVRDLSRFRRDYPGVFEGIRLQQAPYAGSLIVETWKPIYSDTPDYNMGSTGDTVYIKGNSLYSNRILSLACYQDVWGGRNGCSLQRRDPLSSSFSPLNWSSSPLKGGSPGKRNNAEIVYPETNGIIALSLKVIDPALELLMVTVKFDRDYWNASVDIVSTTGRPVRTLRKPLAAGANDTAGLAFDGKDDNGNSLPLGLYFVRFTGFPEHGGGKTISMKAFVIAGGMR